MNRARVWLVVATLWAVMGCQLLEEWREEPVGSPKEPDGSREKPFIVQVKESVSTDDILRAVREKAGLEASQGEASLYVVKENTLHPFSPETLTQGQRPQTVRVDLGSRSYYLQLDWGADPQPKGPSPPADSNPPKGPTPPADSNPPKGPPPPADSNPPKGPTPPADSNPPKGPPPPADSNPPKGPTPPADSNQPEDSPPPLPKDRPQASDRQQEVSALLAGATLGKDGPYFFLQDSTLMLERISLQAGQTFRLGPEVHKFGQALPLRLVEVQRLTKGGEATYQGLTVRARQSTHLGGDLLALTFRHQNARVGLNVQVSAAPSVEYIHLSQKSLFLAGQYRLQKRFPDEDQPIQAVIDPIHLPPGSALDLTHLTTKADGSLPWAGFIHIGAIRLPGDTLFQPTVDDPSTGLSYKDGVLRYTGSQTMNLGGLALSLELVQPPADRGDSFRRERFVAEVEKSVFTSSVLTGVNYQNFWLQYVKVHREDQVEIQLKPGVGQKDLPGLTISIEGDCSWQPSEQCWGIIKHPNYHEMLADLRIMEVLPLASLGDLSLDGLPLRLQGSGKAKLLVGGADGPIDLTDFESSVAVLEGIQLWMTARPYSDALSIQEGQLSFDPSDLGKTFTLEISDYNYNTAVLEVELAQA